MVEWLRTEVSCTCGNSRHSEHLARAGSAQEGLSASLPHTLRCPELLLWPGPLTLACGLLRTC